jgi:hypothetical protein
MTSPNTRATNSARGPESYSRVFRRGLIASALLLAVLPIPVTALHLLPAYRVHARFLIFYAPVVCLLLAAYLFYLRDALARMMFADILNPLADDDPYRPPAVSTAFRRVTRRGRSALLAILPAALVLTSFYCFSRYTTRLQDSVGLAVAMPPQFQASGEELGMVSMSGAAPPMPSGSAGAAASQAPARRTPASARAAQPGQAPGRAPARVVETDTVSPRDRVLRTAGIDAIPLFTELTVLYIGIFAAALVGVVLMALKEYAQEAMGLSEQDLVLGGWDPSGEEGPRGAGSG